MSKHIYVRYELSAFLFKRPRRGLLLVIIFSVLRVTSEYFESPGEMLKKIRH